MKLKRLIRISYFVMLTIVGALVHFDFFFTVVPFTLQALMAVLAGFVLGKADGALSQGLYMALGLIGLPVFARGGGINYILEPSYGYVFALWMGAFATGFAFYKFKTVSTSKLFAAGLMGLAAIYAFGMLYQVIIIAFYEGSGIRQALLSLNGVYIMFAIHVAILYIVCLIYPKALTFIGKRNAQKAAQAPK